MFCPECGARVQQVKDSTSSPQTSGSLDRQTLLAMIGGGLLLVSFIMPWIDSGFISVSGFELIKVASGAEKLLALIAWLVPVGGGITAYFTYTKNVNMRLASLITGEIALVVYIWLIFSIRGDVGGLGNVFNIMGIGLYLMMVGIACLLIGGKK
ncbi:MAG: hypothetical protein KKF00_08015 [Proteobacteria bacterium]|nr:hypothetical protein [Pseudomonadota bacterium]